MRQKTCHNSKKAKINQKTIPYIIIKGKGRSCSGDRLNAPSNPYPYWLCGPQKKPKLQTLTYHIMAVNPANPYPHWVGGGTSNPYVSYHGGNEKMMREGDISKRA